MKNRHILSDADGVLLDWNHGFQNYMTELNYPRLPDTDGYYNISSRHGVSYEEARKHVTEFNHSRAIASLRPFADAVEYVQKLANLGFRFTVVTSLSSSAHAKVNRPINLHNLFGEVFDEIVCLEQGANKHVELTRWTDTGYFWIEDHTEQAEAGYKAGLRPLLINHPYNKDYRTDHFPIVNFHNPWKEIYDRVCEDYSI